MKDMRFRSEFMKTGIRARSSWEEIQGQNYYLLKAFACTQCWSLQKKIHVQLIPWTKKMVVWRHCFKYCWWSTLLVIISRKWFISFTKSPAYVLQAPPWNPPWDYRWCAVLSYTLSYCVEEKLRHSWTEGRGENPRMDAGREVGSWGKIREKAAVQSRTVERV